MKALKELARQLKDAENHYPVPREAMQANGYAMRELVLTELLANRIRAVWDTAQESGSSGGEAVKRLVGTGIFLATVVLASTRMGLRSYLMDEVGVANELPIRDIIPAEELSIGVRVSLEPEDWSYASMTEAEFGVSLASAIQYGLGIASAVQGNPQLEPIFVDNRGKATPFELELPMDFRAI